MATMRVVMTLTFTSGLGRTRHCSKSCTAISVFKPPSVISPAFTNEATEAQAVK